MPLALLRRTRIRKLLAVPRQGTRSVLRAASAAVDKGKTVTPLRQWALQVQARSNHNKATCALANKLARICFATLHDHAAYDDAATVQHKVQRKTFAMPA